MKFVALAALVAAASLTPAVASAQQPATNINKHHHPNLAAAQRLTKRAFDKIVAAQQANEFDLGGHAAKAKDLLDQANTELKAAAMDASMHR